MGYPSSKRPHGEHGGWHDVDDATDPSRRLRPAASATSPAASAHAPRAGSALGTSLAFCLVAGLFAAVWTELAFEWVAERSAGLFTATLSAGVLLRMLAVFACAALLTWAFTRRGERPLDWVFRHRLLIGIVICTLATAFEVSGSSLAMFGDYAHYDGADITIGQPRRIRWDEWCVLTPSLISQTQSGFQGVSEVLRGGGTDTTLVYALPSFSLATVFRPFLWGFLVFGAARGLALFWSARFVALFLATVELGLLVSRGRRGLSLALGVLVSFAPLVLWWFAVNSVAEILIAGELLVVLLARLLRCRSRARATGLICLMAWLAGCYLLALYPAWQVVMFYVFALLGVWVVVDFARGGGRLAVGAAFFALAAALALAAVFALVGLVLYQAKDALLATLDSVYPGSRVSTGGGLPADELLGSSRSMFLPFAALMGSEAEIESVLATFISLFPLGSLLGIWAAFRRRDLLSALLVAAQAAFLLYGFVGVPPVLARLTLLSMVPWNRLSLAIGFSECVLLVRGLALRMEARGRPEGAHARPDAAPARERAWPAPLIAFGVLALGVCFQGTLFDANPTLRLLTRALTLAFALLAAIAALRTRPSGLEERRVLCVALICVAWPGLFVNPVQVGTGPLTENDTARAASAIAAEDPDARWLTDASELAQLLVASGIPTVNSTNLYPNLELWGLVDEDGAYVDVYNRYGSVPVSITTEPTSFESGQPDLIEVHLNADDVPKLGVTYLLTSQDLSGVAGERVSFRPLESVDGRTIYEVVSP